MEHSDIPPHPSFSPDLSNDLDFNNLSPLPSFSPDLSQPNNLEFNNLSPSPSLSPDLIIFPSSPGPILSAAPSPPSPEDIFSGLGNVPNNIYTPNGFTNDLLTQLSLPCSSLSSSPFTASSSFLSSPPDFQSPPGLPLVSHTPPLRILPRTIASKEHPINRIELFLCSLQSGTYISVNKCSSMNYYLFARIDPSQPLHHINRNDIHFMVGKQEVELLHPLDINERNLTEECFYIYEKKPTEGSQNNKVIQGQFLPFKCTIPPQTNGCTCFMSIDIASRKLSCGSFQIRGTQSKRPPGDTKDPTASKRPRNKDIAYWHLVLDEENRPQPGDVVAIRDSGISKNTDGLSLLSIVPFKGAPWIKLGVPDNPAQAKRGVFVCYLGIAVAKVQGQVHLDPEKDHYVLASGNNDGFAVIKPVSQADPSRIVGKLIERELMHEQDGITFVRTMVGLNPQSTGLASLVSEMAEMLERFKQLEKYRIAPCETSGIFGNTVPRLNEYIIERTDLKMVYERVFLQDDGSAGPSQPYLNHCQVTIIYGQIAIGKTTLAESLYHRASDFKRYDQVGYFDVHNKTTQDPNLFVSFYSHFAIQQGESLPNLLSKYRILLIIDGCEDWQLVKPFLSLGCASHIVVTTTLNHLNPTDGDEGIARYPLGPLTLHDATALLRQYAITTPFFQEKIVRYAQGLPLRIIALAHLLIGNGVEGIDKILTGGRPLCLPDTSTALTPIELELYYALAYLKDWDPLPSIFIIHYWEWITQAAQHPWNRICGEHLLHKLERREMIVLTRHQPGNVPLCSVLYPSPIETVTLHQHHREECLSHVLRIFPGVDILAVVFNHLIQAALGGKYSFFLQYGPSPTNPILDFLLQMHLKWHALNDDMFDSEPVCTVVAEYLSDVQDLGEFRRWTITCFEEHMFTPKQPPASLTHASPPQQLHKKFFPFRQQDPDRRLCMHSQIDLLYRVPYCVCEDWAHETMRWFLQRHDGDFLDMVQPFVRQLLSRPDFYASSAVDILDLFSISPDLARIILIDLTTRPAAFKLMSHNHNRLVLLKVLRAIPVGTISSESFTRIVHMLIDKEIENWSLSDSFPIECFAFFHDLYKFLHDPVIQSQLLDPQLVLQKLEAPRAQPSSAFNLQSLLEALPTNEED